MTTQTKAPGNGRLRIAVDIGGTFTDLAAFDEASGELLFGKALTTPPSSFLSTCQSWAA